MCIVDSHLSIVCLEDKAGSKRVLEEFLSDVSRPGRRISRFRNDLGSEYTNRDQIDTKQLFESMLSEFEPQFTNASKGSRSRMESSNGTTGR